MKKALLIILFFVGLGAAGSAQTYGDFQIEGTVLVKYKGKGGTVDIPPG